MKHRVNRLERLIVEAMKILKTIKKNLKNQNCVKIDILR